MDKFRNKYRITSARHQSWDYRCAGAYFITICTANRKDYFGEIENGIMILTQVGVIADIIWYEIPNHSTNVELGEFVVMPNHIHGVLMLTGDGDVNVNAETGHALSLQSPPSPPSPIPPPSNHSIEKSKTIGQQRFQNIGKNSISSIIGSYKSAVSKHAHRLGFNFQWQSRFHDRIIRNDTEYHRIVNYIKTNPENWEQDKFY
jgi:putative transposase